MAYEESTNRMAEFVFGVMLGVFILLITIVLIKGIQGIYNSPAPAQMKLVINSFSEQKMDVLRYKDLISHVSTTALHIAEKVGEIIEWIIQHIT